MSKKHTETPTPPLENELLALLGGLPDSAAFVVGHDLRYRMAQGPALAHSKLKPDEFIGRSVRDVAGAMADTHEKLYRQALAGGTFEFEHQAHGRWFISRGMPMKDSSGHIYAALALSHDITQRKNAEELSRRAQQISYGLVDHAPFGIFLVDKQFKLAHISDGARKVFEGVKPLLGRDFEAIMRQMWPEAFAQAVLAKFRETLRSGQPYRTFDSREKRQDVQVVQAFDWQLFRVDLPDGGHGVVCYFYDVTEMLSVQDTLRRSQQRLELALSAANLGSWDWDVKTNQIQCDERAGRMMGLDFAAPVAFDECEARVHAGDLQSNREAINRALSGGEYQHEFRTVDDGDDQRRFVSRAVVVRDEAGQPLRMIGVTEDVTQARAEADRQRLQAERDAFAVALEAALRPLDDPGRLKFTACELLGRAIGASCVNFGELDSTLDWVSITDDWTDGVPSVAGRWQVSDFRPLLDGLAEFERKVIDDVRQIPDLAPQTLAAFQAYQLAAYVGVPLARDGRWHAVLGVNCARPRAWTQEHLWRIELTAKRTAAAVEKAQVERALVAAEQRYRAFIDQSSEGIWRIEFEPPVDTAVPARQQIKAALKDGRFAECNDQMAKMYGLASADLLINSGPALMLSGSPQRHLRCLSAMVKGGYRAVDVESELLCADGKKRWYLHNLQGVVENGKLARVWGTQRDITERKAQEAALHASESRFRSLVMVVTDVPWTTQPNGEMVEEQAAWQAYTGQSYEQYSGFGWYQAVHPDDRAALLEDWQHSLHKLSNFLNRGRLWHAATQQYRHYVAQAAPLLDSAGVLRGWIGACNDVHDEALHAQQMAQADQRKDAFLATLAHELRNPLAPIRTAAALLQLPELSNEVAARARVVIERQTRHMALLLDDLLDVARITQGKLVLKKQRLRLKPVIDDALESVRTLIEQGQHQISVDLPEQDIELLADPVRLTQVVANLLTNAANYTPQGGHLQLRARVADGQMHLDIEDDGIGIEADALATIFDMFVQANSLAQATLRPVVAKPQSIAGKGGLNSAGPGLGIGLAIVKGLVELHGGRVSATSPGHGCGSCFTVQLPMPQDIQPLQAPAAAVAAQPEKAFRPLRVLVADDNRDAAELLVSLLQMRGHETLTVYDGAAALQAVVDFMPHVAVLDIGMPLQDGYQVSQRLRSAEQTAQGQRLRLAALTGWGQATDRQRALDAGFDAHFTKPVDTEQLLSWVEARQI